MQPKAIQHTGTTTTSGATYNLQPPLNKAWWFKALRYAVHVGPGDTLYINRTGYVATSVGAKSWAGGTYGINEAGEIEEAPGALETRALRATNGQYLQIKTNGHEFSWSFLWLGVEF
jgi:hypothetical protein